MTEWVAQHIGFENDDLTIAGLTVWREAWRPVGREWVTLPHPAYPNQRHRFDIYEIGDPPIRFAAGELSNGVWGFYVPA